MQNTRRILNSALILLTALCCFVPSLSTAAQKKPGKGLTVRPARADSPKCREERDVDVTVPPRDRSARAHPRITTPSPRSFTLSTNSRKLWV